MTAGFSFYNASVAIYFSGGGGGGDAKERNIIQSEQKDIALNDSPDAQAKKQSQKYLQSDELSSVTHFPDEIQLLVPVFSQWQLLNQNQH